MFNTQTVGTHMFDWIVPPDVDPELFWFAVRKCKLHEENTSDGSKIPWWQAKIADRGSGWDFVKGLQQIEMWRKDFFTALQIRHQPGVPIDVINECLSDMEGAMRKIMAANPEKAIGLESILKNAEKGR